MKPSGSEVKNLDPKMKRHIGKYLFEVSVIFIGITLGFIFDEWRDRRNDDAEKKQVYQSILAELTRTKDLLRRTDSINTDLVKGIRTIVANNKFDHESTLYILDFLTSDFQLNLDGTLNTLKSLTEQNSRTFSKNPVIAQNISYIFSIAADHNRIIDDLRVTAQSGLLPLLLRHNVVLDIANYRADGDSTLHGDYPKLLKDPDFNNQLRLIVMKRESLSLVYATLIRDFDRIATEIDKEIKTEP
jgi:hypothetical protein